MLRKNVLTCSLERLKERLQIHLRIGEWTWKELVYGRYERSILVYSSACLLVSIKVTFVNDIFTFVGKAWIRFMCVVMLIYFLSKALQYVLCLCRLMYAVVREFILVILSDILKCTNQCDFLVWPFANNVYSILCDICLTRGSKCTNHPKRSSEFVFCHVHFLVLILWLVYFVRSSG